MTLIPLKYATLLCSVSVLFFSACQQDAGSDTIYTEMGDTIRGAGEYNDYLVSEQDKIVYALLSLSEKYPTRDSSVVFKTFDSLMVILESSYENVKSLAPYDSDSSLRDATLELFEFYREIFNEEIKQITKLTVIHEDSVTTEDVNKMDSLSYNLTLKEQKADGIFQYIQNQFAEKHNLVFGEDILQNLDLNDSL